MKAHFPNPDELARFADERLRFKLQYQCTDCIHENPDTGLCSLYFPNDDLMGIEGYAGRRGEFLFCKTFEAV